MSRIVFNSLRKPGHLDGLSRLLRDASGLNINYGSKLFEELFRINTRILCHLFNGETVRLDKFYSLGARDACKMTNGLKDISINVKVLTVDPNACNFFGNAPNKLFVLNNVCHRGIDGLYTQELISSATTMNGVNLVQNKDFRGSDNKEIPIAKITSQVARLLKKQDKKHPHLHNEQFILIICGANKKYTENGIDLNNLGLIDESIPHGDENSDVKEDMNDTYEFSEPPQKRRRMNTCGMKAKEICDIKPKRIFEIIALVGKDCRQFFIPCLRNYCLFTKTNKDDSSIVY